MRRGVVLAGAALVLGACAASEQKSAPAKAPAYEAAGGIGAPDSAAQAYPAQPAQPGYPAPPPMPTAPAASIAPTTSPTAPGMAELDRAQRELDVAAGDCHNACRALSSMDRAAGRICSLSSGNDTDKQRCSDAKDRVYSARDKVKNSCGTCAETSVDRNAPVPSTR